MPKLRNSQYECEIEINRFSMKQDLTVANQPVPTRPEGSNVNVGVWVQHIPTMNFICHVNDENLEILQMIYDATQKVELILEYSEVKFEGWLENMQVTWDGDRNWDNPWLVTFKLLPSATQENFAELKTSLNVDCILASTKCWMLREHRPWYLGPDDWVAFGFTVSSTISCGSVGNVAYGVGYIFKTFPKSFLQGKKIRVRYRWDGYSYGNGLDYHWFRCQLWDGAYTEDDDTTFPDSQPVVLKGNGVVQTLIEQHGRGRGSSSPNFVETTIAVNVNNAVCDDVTLVFSCEDRETGGSQNWSTLDIDYVHILDENNNVVWRWEFNSGAIVMERSGTARDYGYYKL